MRRQPHHVVEIVGDENQRDVERLAQPIDFILKMAAHHPIDRGKRLVEQQDRRLTRQRPRQRDALTLPARQLAAAGDSRARTD